VEKIEIDRDKEKPYYSMRCSRVWKCSADMKLLNLKKLNIVELRFDFSINLMDDLLEKVESVVAADKDGDYMFMDPYRIDNVGHVLATMVSKSGVPEIYRVRGIWEIRKGRVSSKGLVSVGKLFEIISSIEAKTMLEGSLRLSFSRRKKYKSIINLPIKITDMPKMTYDEIHGMHFVKREGRDFKYDVILDVERDGSLTELVIYQRRMEVKESILEDIIQEGLEISDCFVLRGK
jgi:hypothetical protein